MKLSRLRLSKSTIGASGVFSIYTDAVNTSTFDPSWTFSAGGGPMTVNWGDGSPSESHATGLSHTYAAGSGRKRVVFSCPDWSKITKFWVDSDLCRLHLPKKLSLTKITQLLIGSNQFTGTIPTISTLTDLRAEGNLLSGSVPTPFNLATNFWSLNNNQFTGSLPSFAAYTQLVNLYVNANQISGTLPSFQTNTALRYLYIDSNQFTGTMPSFALCTDLREFRAYGNQFSGYQSGSFATQALLSTLNLKDNRLSQANVDAILADLVTSLSIPGRGSCTVSLDDSQNQGTAATSNNADPSAVDGMADVATLRAAGWTVNVKARPWIFAFGDSITTGVSWPQEVHTGYLSGVNHVIDFAIGSARIMGTVDENSLAKQVAKLANHDANYVFILMGTNDIVVDDTLRAKYEENLEAIKTLNPAATIYGLGILDKTNMTNVATIRGHIQTACANAGVTYVDTSGWINPATDTSDGIHPNAAGKTKIANAVLAILPV